MKRKKKKSGLKRVVNVLFCGTGGQGVLSAAEILGVAAMRDGFHVKKSEVHGMAQRGGSVESHVRFGSQVFSPLILKGAADVLVAFHRDEHARLKDFLRGKGVDLIDELDRARSAVLEARFVNTYLLGVLSRHLPLSSQSWLEALAIVFKGKHEAVNREVFLKARGDI